MIRFQCVLISVPLNDVKILYFFTLLENCHYRNDAAVDWNIIFTEASTLIVFFVSIYLDFNVVKIIVL